MAVCRVPETWRDDCNAGRDVQNAADSSTKEGIGGNTIMVDDVFAFLDKMGQRCFTLPDTYGETLAFHRKKRGLSQEELAWRLGISERTLREYETGKVLEPSRVFFASVGRILHLPGIYTRDMMKKAGCPLDDTQEPWFYFGYVVDKMYLCSLKDCNAVMTRYQLPTLIGRDDDEPMPQQRFGKMKKR